MVLPAFRTRRGPARPIRSRVAEHLLAAAAGAAIASAILIYIRRRKKRDPLTPVVQPQAFVVQVPRNMAPGQQMVVASPFTGQQIVVTILRSLKEAREPPEASLKSELHALLESEDLANICW